MDQRLDELERQLRDLSKKVEQLDAKVTALSAGLPELPAEPSDARAAETVAPAAAPAGDAETGFSGTASLLGRTLLVVAGAFVIRAATDRELVPRSAGVAMGLAFASVWLVMAARAAARQKLASATWHAVAASVIGFPLVFETATRLAVLSAPVAAGVLAAFTFALAGVGAVAGKRRFVWLATAGGLLTAAGLMLQAPSTAGLSVVLLLFGLGTLALEDVRGWGGPRWPVALFVDAVAVRAVFRSAGNEELRAEVAPAMALLLAAAALYLSGALLRSWVRRRRVGGFEAVQSGLALLLVIASSSRTEEALGWNTAVGLALLALSAAAVFTVLWRCAGDGFKVDRWVYGLFALVTVLVGGPMVLRGPGVELGWAALALVAAFGGRTRLTPTLWGFAGVLGWAAALRAGLVGLTAEALFGDLSAAAHGPSGALLGVVALALATELAATVRAPAVATWLRGVPAALLALVTLAALAGTALGLRSALGSTADAGVVILLRTLTMLAAALLLAVGRRLGGPIELAWISGALLGLSGLKILVQDLPSGRAGPLAIAFLCLGAMIIVFPKLTRRPGATPPPAAPAAPS